MLLNQQKKTNDLIAKVQKDLQESLIEGWKEFMTSKDLNTYKEFFSFILQAGFDESIYRKIIPNPAYDNAAKLIGKPFLETARKLEIHFDEIFPGNFTASKEIEKADYEIRQFHLKAYYKSKPLCLFLLTFPHQHDRLDFPTPPELEIEKLY